MTFDEIAYNILNLVRAGRSNHDEMISLDQIKFNILHYRAMFIRRDYARNGKITRHLEQDLHCVNTVLTDTSRCCEGFQTGCVIARTTVPIPRTVRLNFKEAITYVGGVDGMSEIQLIEPYMAKLASYAKYTGKNKKAFKIAQLEKFGIAESFAKLGKNDITALKKIGEKAPIKFVNLK